jgi:hypothetical protein
MRYEGHRRHALIWAVLVAAMITCSSRDDRSKAGADKPNSVKDTNMIATYDPAYFGDSRRSSFLPVSSAGRGELTWTRPLGLPAGLRPVHLFVWNEMVVVDADLKVAAFDLNGGPLWSRDKAADSPLGFRSQTVYYRDAGYRLSAVNSRGQQVVNATYFPDGNDKRFHISLFQTQDSAFLSVIQFDGGPQELPVKTYIELTNYGNRMAEWICTIEGLQTLRPLFLKDQKRVVVFLDRIVYVQAGDGKEIGRADMPLPTVYSASADSSGNLYLLGRNEDLVSLVVQDGAGKELWRWVDSTPGRVMAAGQPPILGKDGKVHLLAAGSILTLVQGTLAWEHVVDEPGYSYAVALADGTLLASAGGTLERVSSGGDRVFAVTLKQSIVAPPTVDIEGHVFVAAETELVRID